VLSWKFVLWLVLAASALAVLRLLAGAIGWEGVAILFLVALYIYTLARFRKLRVWILGASMLAVLGLLLRGLGWKQFLILWLGLVTIASSVASLSSLFKGRERDD
jgi:hypothetical protein